PLPDERPRGSVANLIGRFETQVKRQSSSSPASARSLSATSHMSGDSAKEEAKERREWPPKSASPDAKGPITIPSSSFARSLALAQAVSAEATLGTAASEAQADLVAAASLTPRPRSPTSNSDNPKPVVTTPPQRQLSIDVIPSTPITTGTPITAKPPTTAKPARATGKPSTTTSGRTPARSMGPRPFTAPAAQPIKSQNTGPGKPSFPSRKPVMPPTSASIAHKAAKPASTRPKTPSSMQSRTPSSGLFAPTAASLAKSRNTQQSSAPIPIKKVASSSAGAERLSKPTAASLSRTRTPTAVGMKPTASARSATRGVPATRPKTSSAGTLTKKTGTTSTAKKAAAAAVVAEPEPVPELLPAENGHQPDEDHIDEHPEDAVNSEKQPPEQDNSVIGESSKAEAGDITTDQHLNEKAGENANNETDVVSPDNLESHDTPSEHSEKAEPAPVNDDHEATEVKPEGHVGNEIEDMVNLLESVSISKVRPESIATIPDEE
ncbi:hypothetical protein C0989_009092, partial [Termitomyces sp. Mn162]